MTFVIGLFSPFYVVFVEKLGQNIAFAGLSWGLFAIVSGILILLFSNWELQVKEQELLCVAGYMLRGVVFLSYAFMTSVPQLLVTQVLWGISIALSTPAFDSLYSAHTSKEDAILQWGGWEGMVSISAGLAAILGGVLIEYVGFTAIFIAMACISMFLGIYIWRLPRELL
jgi:predicted MFS family arabinose efflux permease